MRRRGSNNGVWLKFYQLSVSDILTPWSEVNTWPSDALSMVKAFKASYFSFSFKGACSTTFTGKEAFSITEDMVQKCRMFHVSPFFIYVGHCETWPFW